MPWWWVFVYYFYVVLGICRYWEVLVIYNNLHFLGSWWGWGWGTIDLSYVNMLA